MAGKQAVRRDEVGPPESRKKCRRTKRILVDGRELAFTVVLNKKYVYLGKDEILRASVFLKSNEEEQVQVNGDLSVYIVNNEGNELRIPRQFWLRCGTAELFIPLVGKHMDGFVLGRWFRIVVTMESSPPPWGLGLGTKRGIKGIATAEAAASGDVVPGELLQGESETLLQYGGMILVTKQPKVVYYKDEGGKKNTLEIEVIVLQGKRTGGEVPLPYVPLAMKLVYSDFYLEEVPDQSILKIIPECRMLTGLDGMLKIQFRVSQVTKRHNGKKFKVCVETYNQLGSESVVVLLPAYSSPFSVLSKQRRIDKGGSVKGCYISRTDFAKSTWTVSHLQDGHCLENTPPKPPPSVLPPTLEYCLMLQSAYLLIAQLQWYMIGSLTSTEKNVRQVVPSFRCPMCGVSPDPYIPTSCTHDVRCGVGQWLELYERNMLKGKRRAPGVNGSYLIPADEDHQPQPLNFNMPQKTAHLIGGCEQNDDSNGRDETNFQVGLNSQPFHCDSTAGDEHSHEDQHPLKEEPVYLNDLPIGTDLDDKHSMFAFCDGI